MPRPFVPLTPDQFAERLENFHFTRKITAVHMHHTWKPRKTDYTGVGTIEGMWRFHTQNNGWSDIAQHLSIAPNGTIWTGRDWNRTPASASGFSTGAFMFETIGNFDKGQERLEGAQRRAVVDVIARVQLKCGLPVESLHFHREFTDQKTCPGTGISKAEILAEVRQRRAELVGARELAPGARGGEGPFAERYEDTGISGLSRATEEEGEVACNEMAEVDSVGMRGARGRGLDPEEIRALRPHVVNLTEGMFSTGGSFRTTEADVDAIFRDHLPRWAEEMRGRGKPVRVLFYAHGGLVGEGSGLTMAHKLVEWWKDNGIYPVYFVWETGLLPTIVQLLRGSREAVATRGFVSDRITDPALEAVARTLGGEKIWSGMKRNAERATRSDGGARYVAGRLKEFCDAHTGAELHAVGHSAGSIFHAHFLPTALDLGAPHFRSLHFLAPAIRVDAFLERLEPRIGSGRGVEALSVFTMSDEQERRDNCGGVYRKSLLYLIHKALEVDRRAPILGLEISLAGDPRTRGLFGLDGGSGRAEVIWSPSGSETGHSASRSTTHGGFDNDRATMESVVRRVLGPDGGEIRPFPAEAERAFEDELQRVVAEALGEVSAEEPDTGTPQPDGGPQEERKPSRPARPKEGGARRALCIGINEYSTAPLNGCVADAELWAKVLRRDLGFEEIRLLRDREATRDNILSSLEELVESGRSGDVLVFQYAGHGTHFKDDGSDEDDAEDEALVPIDFNAGRMVLDDEQFEIFSRLRDGVSLTCFYDCCHSGTMSRAALSAMASFTFGTRDIRPRFMNPTSEMRKAYRTFRKARQRALRTLHGPTGLRAVAFSACRDDQVAMEVDGQGVFTRIATRILPAAASGRISHSEFQRQITDAFGPEATQNPELFCNPAARTLALLQPLEATTGAGERPHVVDMTGKAWKRLLDGLNEEQREELSKLLSRTGTFLNGE